MGNLITVLLQISSRLRHRKNFENRPVFDEVMPKILLVRFFPDTVYNRRTINLLDDDDDDDGGHVRDEASDVFSKLIRYPPTFDDDNFKIYVNVRH